MEGHLGFTPPQGHGLIQQIEPIDLRAPHTDALQAHTTTNRWGRRCVEVLK